MAASFWWFTLTLNMFNLLVLEVSRTWAKRIYYGQHFINWGIPSIGVIVGIPYSVSCLLLDAPNHDMFFAALARKSPGADDVGPNCWLNSPEDYAIFYDFGPSPCPLQHLGLEFCSRLRFFAISFA
jgi:hypothetical protein